MVVSTDQWCPEFGSSYCHSLCLSKCKWDNNHMFLDIICIYFLLLCKVLNTKSCLSKFATKLMFHWEPIIILYFLYLCFLQLVHGDIKSNPRRRDIAKIIYHHFVTGNLIAYQHIALQRCYF